MPCCCQVSFARDEPFSPSDEPGIIGKWINRAHQEISTRVLKTSERFDAFFEISALKKKRRSRKLLSPNAHLLKGRSYRSELSINGEPCAAVPEKSLHLMVETLWQEEQEDDEKPETSADEKQDVTVSLRYKSCGRRSAG